jgi:DNA recombination protein RmuC
METVIIAILALVSLALIAALLVVVRRPDQRQGGMKDILETLVDPRVAEMRSEMNKVSDLVRNLEKDRENKFGQLTNQLKNVGEQTSLLASTTGQLREALANTRARGQWGERMAEDVLRLTGFVEGVNYLKQATIGRSGGSSGENGGARPDFTFLLPQDRKLNMDVKFPLDNYMKCVEAKTVETETQFRQQFVRDVRDRLKEVVTRDYIDPSQKTLDYVLVFIPNEQIYQFIHEHDSSLIETAMTNKVVLCSPVSLFAILLVIRQAVDNFTLEQGSNQIAAQMGAFKKQWESFVDQIDRLGKSIQVVQSHFDLLSGRRRRALERPLNRIEAIRQDLGLGLPAGAADDDAQMDLELPELELAEAGEPETR